jgi:formate/nitrite transporter FocA (FNT family)
LLRQSNTWYQENKSNPIHWPITYWIELVSLLLIWYLFLICQKFRIAYHILNQILYNCIVSKNHYTFLGQFGLFLTKIYCIIFLYLALFMNRYKNFDKFVLVSFFETIKIQCIQRKGDTNTNKYRYMYCIGFTIGGR